MFRRVLVIELTVVLHAVQKRRLVLPAVVGIELSRSWGLYAFTPHERGLLQKTCDEGDVQDGGLIT